MFKGVYYPGLRELEGTYFYREVPKRISSARREPPHRVRRTVKCPKGAIFLFEGEPIGARRQNVFKCPIHNDIIILPRGYDWEFVKILSYGEKPLFFSGFWQGYPYKRRTLPYPKKEL